MGYSFAEPITFKCNFRPHQLHYMSFSVPGYIGIIAVVVVVAVPIAGGGGDCGVWWDFHPFSSVCYSIIIVHSAFHHSDFRIVFFFSSSYSFSSKCCLFFLSISQIRHLPSARSITSVCLTAAVVAIIIIWNQRIQILFTRAYAHKSHRNECSH